VTLDGLNSGVPTRTTPTLTPTTLRNIEQTFIELQNEVESHQNEAGFVPPVVQPITQGSGVVQFICNL
jgi:fos-like antigen